MRAQQYEIIAACSGMETIMRRRGPFPGLLSITLILVGTVILLAMVLPSGFWWFILGLGLVFLGLLFANKC